MKNQPVNPDQAADQAADQATYDSAQQFYIAKTGSDTTGDGTLLSPWQSLSHAIGSIPAGKDNITLNLRGGTYPLANTILIHDRNHNDSSSILVIRSHEGETAILDGNMIPDFGAMISIRNSHHVILNNLELTNLIGNKSGIHVTGDSSNITISHNTVHGMHWTTDANAAKSPAPTDNLNPIVIVGDSPSTMRDISVLHNKVYDLTTGYSEAIKITGNIDGFLIAGNEVHDVANIGIVAAGNYAWVGLQDTNLNQARNGVIQENVVYRCISPVAASAGIYVDGARDITVNNNYSHHNTVGFSVGSEQPGQSSAIVLSNNVSESNTQAGVVIGTISPDSMVEEVELRGNKLHGNYTNPVWGGAPIIINKSKNVSITENTIGSISQYMATVNAFSENLALNNNRYESTTVTAEQAVFSWLGINNLNYTGFDNYRSGTGQDSASGFNQGGEGTIAIFINSIRSFFTR